MQKATVNRWLLAKNRQQAAIHSKLRRSIAVLENRQRLMEMRIRHTTASLNQKVLLKF